MAYYNNIKLEKGMYHVGGKNFTGVLESMDPSENYKGTEFEGLDAYQRQLKRFNIKVSGAGCDKVEKFFCTSDSAVLFPEYISRAVKQGLDSLDVLKSIVAATTVIDSTDYRAITSSSSSDGPIDEGQVLHEVKVATENLVSLSKHGRIFSSTYEALRFQNLDVLTIILKKIGADIANEELSDAVAELNTNTISLTAEGALTYDNLLSIWAGVSPYKLNVMMANTATMKDILGLAEMKDAAAGLDFQGTGKIVTPMGAKLLCCENVANKTIIGLDKDFALQLVQSGEVVVDYDKVIDMQLAQAAISVTAGFSKIFNDSIVKLTYGS